MKKGDIVKLKEGQTWRYEDAQAMGYNSIAEVSEFLEVEEVDQIMSCCVPTDVFKIAGHPFYIKQKDFEVALAAGEPDVEKLLRESREREMASMGF